MTKEYKPSIGIECHVQLRTRTKLFSAVSNDAREAMPNTLISHICLGMPGALPVLNEQAVELAMQASFALNTIPQKFSKFDRKHYFYPDLPKGYQITQFDEPIILGGSVNMMLNDKQVSVRINRAHLEEDAGKTSHPDGEDHSFVDLNRAGTPLLEIVSEPDMHSSQEAKAYARELWLLMRYAEVSDADLFHGNMRFDVNVSLSNTNKLGTRTETKNLNSFRSVERAVEYEIKRQSELLSKGKKIIQETRGWNDAKQKTFSQRGKEDSHDYRYFPDPDLPPIVLSDVAINTVKDSLPAMPMEIRSKLQQLELDNSAIETLLDEMKAGKFISDLLDTDTKPNLVKKIANWLVGEVQAKVSENELEWPQIVLEEQALIELAELSQLNKLSSSAAKKVLIQMVKTGGKPLNIAKDLNILQISNEAQIEELVIKVISKNKQAIEDIKAGETKAIGYLVGQIMKESKGKANPALAQKLIKEKINDKKYSSSS
jgi:aspartyl-tRNA(Asn)/glutamyl-tRNA(Gln) amidotransferase subunit B